VVLDQLGGIRAVSERAQEPWEDVSQLGLVEPSRRSRLLRLRSPVGHDLFVLLLDEL
jgi:hypothetical protein